MNTYRNINIEDNSENSNDLKSIVRKRLLTGSEAIDCYDQSKKYEDLVEGIFRFKGMAALVGESDAFKSTFARNLALAIVNKEKEFIGRKLSRDDRSVLYVSTEDSVEDTGELLKRHAAITTLQYPLRRNLDKLHFMFDTYNIATELDDYLSVFPCKLVIIDCFGDTFEGDSNALSPVRSYFKPLKRLTDKHKCLILFIHHKNKQSANREMSKHNISGSQAFEAKMRVVLELKPDEKESDVFHLCFLKANRMSRAEKAITYPVRFIESSLTFVNDAYVGYNRMYVSDLNKKGKKQKSLKDDPEFVKKAENLLYNQNLSFEVAAKKLQELGYNVSRSSLNSWFKKGGAPSIAA